MIGSSAAQVFGGIVIGLAAVVLLLLEVMIAAGISALRRQVDELELGLRQDIGALIGELRERRPAQQPAMEGDTPSGADS